MTMMWMATERQMLLLSITTTTMAILTITMGVAVIMIGKADGHSDYYQDDCDYYRLPTMTFVCRAAMMMVEQRARTRMGTRRRRAATLTMTTRRMSPPLPPPTKAVKRGDSPPTSASGKSGELNT